MRKRIAVALVGATVALLTTPVVAQAAHPGVVKMVVLGDSYASGVGAGNNYQPSTVGNCWRSNDSYGEQLARNLRASGKTVSLSNVSCSGATTDTVRQQQLSALKWDTTLVAAQFGGNDLGFGPYSELCIFSDCSGAPSEALKNKMSEVRNKVAALLVEVQLRAPKAQLVLVGYGRILSPTANPPGAPVDPICELQYFTLAERTDTSEVSAKLDRALQKAHLGARWLGVKVKFISPYINNDPQAPQLDPLFANHSLCQSGLQYYRGFDALPPSPVADAAGRLALLHLNVPGHTAMAQFIRNKVPALN